MFVVHRTAQLTAAAVLWRPPGRERKASHSHNSTDSTRRDRQENLDPVEIDLNKYHVILQDISITLF